MQKDTILQCTIQILCAILCSIMAFLGTWYASKSTLQGTYISEYNNRNRQIFEKKIDEYSNFYFLALQEIDLSNMTLDGIRKNLEILKINYKNVQKSCALLSILCSLEEALLVKKISVEYTDMYVIFLINYNKLNEIITSEEASDIKKEIISQYTDKLGEVRRDLNALEEVMRNSVKKYSSY